MTENTQQAGGVPRRNRAAFAAAGLAIGAAAGAVAYSRRRPDQQTPRDPLSQEVLVQPSRLVDWEQARSIAINMNRGEAMTPSLNLAKMRVGWASAPFISIQGDSSCALAQGPTQKTTQKLKKNRLILMFEISAYFDCFCVL